MFCKSIFFIFIIIFAGIVYSQQRIQDFYLSNYKDTGKTDWEVRGKEATVSDKYVEIEVMEGKFFRKDDTIDIKADKAKLDKLNMDVYLEDNVRINNSQGITLNTDFLNWKQNSNKVSTDRWVQVAKEDSLTIEAKGLEADTELNKVDFQKEVKVDIPNQEETIKITCDGPLEIDYEEGKAIFNNNVVVDHDQGKMFSQEGTVYFDSETNSIIKIVAQGDVKIIRDDNVTFAERAVYLEEEKKIILEGRPRLVFFPQKKTSFFNRKPD